MTDRRQHLRQSLDLRLTQRLALTPSLLQKIELLQLNRLELQEMLNQELLENPMLEEVTEPEAPKDLGLEEPADVEPAGAVTARRRVRNATHSTRSISATSSTSTSIRDTENREVEESEDKPSFEAYLVRPPSLSDHLNWQLGLSFVEPRIAEIAREIIGNLNDDGYLLLTIEELQQPDWVHGGGGRDRAQVRAIAGSRRRRCP